jgi:hypothetical protein
VSDEPPLSAIVEKMVHVAASSLDVAGEAENWHHFLYHFGAAMGVLSHAAYETLSVAASNTAPFRARFLEGFDQGVRTGQGVEQMMRDPRHADVE